MFTISESAWQSLMDLVLRYIIPNGKSVLAGLRSEAIVNHFRRWRGALRKVRISLHFGRQLRNLISVSSLHLAESERPALGATPRHTRSHLMSLPPHDVFTYHTPPTSRLLSLTTDFILLFSTSNSQHCLRLKQTPRTHSPIHKIEYSTGKKRFNGMVSTTTSPNSKRAMLTIPR
jgi:hypothetical protein